MKARSAKAKGTRLEKWVQDTLRHAGLRARRQPGSGAFAAFPKDVELILGEGTETVRLLMECKSWRDGWRTGDKALGEAQLLVIKRDRGEPRVYMHWDTFKLLAHSAHQLFSVVGREDPETKAALEELDRILEQEEDT